MEPVTSLISAAVSYMVETISGAKSFKDFIEDFSNATIDWIRPIFLTDEEKPKEVLADLQKEPNDKLNIQAAENAIAKAIRDEPSLEIKLRDLVNEMQKKSGDTTKKSNTITMHGNENTGIQDVSGSTININSNRND